MRCIIGHSYAAVGGFSDFTVQVSNAGYNTILFTLQDTANIVTSVRMVRAILCDAIEQWLALNRAGLDANGDTDVVGATAFRPGDGFARFDFTFGDKTAQVELSDDAGISDDDELTVEIPYADVV